MFQIRNLEQREVWLLPNQTWVCSPSCSEANLLTSSHGERKYSIFCRVSSKENEWLMIKRAELLNGFKEKVLKSKMKERVVSPLMS